MDRTIQRIVIVGGGTAGWLSACYLAARAAEISPGVQITLVESPDIATIGVGEGTWPTMRETLATIGIDEAEFLAACDGSFKQGSRFDGWVSGEAGDSYLHPFTAPPAADINGLARGLGGNGRKRCSFAAAMTAAGARLRQRPRAAPGGDARLRGRAQLCLSSRCREARRAAVASCGRAARRPPSRRPRSPTVRRDGDDGIAADRDAATMARSPATCSSTAAGFAPC